MLKILSSSFQKGATASEGLPRDFRPHIAFLGRSNVGKSSFLNTLVQKKNLARSSSRPGKTTEVNFFLINEKLYFVDLPGYGYARQPKPLRAKILEMISWYTSDQSLPIQKLILLIDANVGFTEIDWDILDFLSQHHDTSKILIVLNKVDKLQKSKKLSIIKKLEEEAATYQCVGFSSMSGEGREKLLHAL